MPRVEEVCTITAKGQTTVPKAVRQALGVGYGGKIAFRVEEGRVTVHGLAGTASEDPALTPFLALLAADMSDRAEQAVRPLPAALVRRLETLAAAAGAVEPDDVIEGEVSL